MWDEVSERALKKHHEEGLSASESGNRLAAMGYHFSRNAIIGKRHRLGIVITAERRGSRPKGMPIDRPKPGSVLRPTPDVSSRRGARKAMASKFGETLSDAKRQAPSLPTEPATPSPAEGLTFMELKSDSCRYPVAERDGEHIFCGATRRKDSAYCGDHHKRCFVPVKDYKPKWMKPTKVEE